MAKKQKCPEFENHERWLVSYADMLTLLFAVFVVLFALKEGGEPQVQQAAGSMQESFNTPLEDIPLDRRDEPSEQGFGVFEHFQGDRLIPPPMQKYPSLRNPVHVIDAEMSRVKIELDERLYGPQKFRPPQKPGNERIIDIKRTPKGFKLVLLARYFFDKNSVKVRKEALSQLDKVVETIKDLGRDITVEGHTDSLPPGGSYSNWDISALRATDVVRYMITHHQFPQTRLSAAGYADTRPIADNGTEAGRAVNRRIEVHVQYEGQNSDNLNPGQ